VQLIDICANHEGVFGRCENQACGGVIIDETIDYRGKRLRKAITDDIHFAFALVNCDSDDPVGITLGKEVF
ncbi:hypothetical protein R0K04_29400, partial [Pseudoalteromonas sp. SIMBA_153]